MRSQIQTDLPEQPTQRANGKLEARKDKNKQIFTVVQANVKKELYASLWCDLLLKPLKYLLLLDDGDETT